MYSKITFANMSWTKQKQRTRQKKKVAKKGWKNKQAKHTVDPGYLSLDGTNLTSLSNHLLSLKPTLKT